MTLREVADACGVSVSTASNALTGRGRLSPETRAHVRAVAERLGYAPDPLAARLSSRRFSRSNERVGLTVLFLCDVSIRTGALALAAMRQRAARLGYVVKSETLPKDRGKLPALLRKWRTQGVAGLIFGRLTAPLPTELEEWGSFALAACAGTAFVPPCHRVNLDPLQTVLCCWGRLRSKGYRAIGLAIGRHDVEVEDDHLRLAGALLANARRGPGEREVPLFLGVLNSDGAGLRAWFAEHRPDAVVGFTSKMLFDLEQGGWRSPRDFAFASLHCMKFIESVSGHDWLLDEIAVVAIELADQLIRHRETGWPERPRLTSLPARWVEGVTTPPAAAAR